ncbi:T-cell immunomodulatory protein [Choanephora cucurbitarum]|uniref:T-cell immunomodulatory protein n=1 Tax=Choanephora cucurbitarum TaxID=101091 RepID=A0A1C7N377_9FUNG|nr:T-cell immunomodulatory protein [Choanephora cucurbitarum]
MPNTIRAQALNYASRFPSSQLYGLKPDSIGLDNLDGTIAAFGDFNGDKFTDIFVLSSDQTSVCVYIWDHQGFSFKQLPQQIQPGFIVTNIVPGDFNYDGHLDVLLMGEQNPEKDAASEIKLQVYLGNGNDTFASETIKLPSAQGALPIVLDINGDMKTDLLGYAKDTNELSIWTNQAPSPLFNLTSASGLFNKTASDRCRWANPHSNAFVDLDGDCLADLVFVCDGSIQIWTHQRQQGFSLAHEASLPTGAGPLTFSDIDGDGSIDIVFPVCEAKDCSIHVAYNQQMGLCNQQQKEDGSSRCRKARDLCVADPDFKFDFTGKNTRDYVIYPLAHGEHIKMNDVHFRGHLPVPVHAGDYNLDGYPGLLVATDKRAILLGSVLCDSNTCSDEAATMARRTFSEVTAGTDDLKSISSPSQAAFFDIDEDGSLDILVLEYKKDAGRTPHFIINNFFNDAFFLKGLVSNGVDTEAYGVNYPGASFKFTVLDTSGTKRSHQISQLSQSGYLSLQTPYCLFGLGRTNNYVEEMFAGVSRHQAKNYLFYEGVIPNSQLVFLPYQPEYVQDSSSWKVELYIKPADYVPWVLVVLVSASVILAIVAVVLRTMEKREDEMERRKALHIINFDAL